MDFPSLTEFKARNTLKWTRYGDDVLPLWVAESDFSTCPEVKAAIMDAVQRESFGYPPPRPRPGAGSIQYNPLWLGHQSSTHFPCPRRGARRVPGPKFPD